MRVNLRDYIPKCLLPTGTVVNRKRSHLIQTAHVLHYDARGKVLWEDWTEPNLLTDQGEIYILARVFATGTASPYDVTAANMYLGLSTNVPAESDTLASITGEPTTGGYARIANSTAGTGAAGQDFVSGTGGAGAAAYYKLTTKTCTFTHNTSGASWSSLAYMFLTNHASATTGNVLVAEVALSTTRTVANTGESLATTLYLGLSE